MSDRIKIRCVDTWMIKHPSRAKDVRYHSKSQEGHWIE